MKKPNLLSRIGLAITRVRNFVINAVFLLLVVGIIVGIVQGAMSLQVEDGSALVIDPAGVIVEEARPDYSLTGLLSQPGGPGQTGINDLLRAVDQATDDDRIRAIVLKLDDLMYADTVYAVQLGDALEGFKAAGKEVIAFGTTYSQSRYAIASFANAIYLHPFGEVGFPGYRFIQSYYKGLLDRLGINVHLFRVGDYKSAGEFLVRESMSPEARENAQQLVDGRWGAYRQLVLANRSLDADDFDRYATAYDEVIEQFSGDQARAALEFRLADELLTPDHLNDRVAATVGEQSGNDYPRIGYRQYLQTLPPRVPSKRHIAIVTAQGPIMMGDDRNAAAADNLVALIRQAREDESVAALVLRIDSPGGSATASELIREELEVMQQHDKPVVASMGPVAASGGYWIASTANRIIAHPTTITGSIGVIGMFPNLEQALSNFGIESDGVESLPRSWPMLGQDLSESSKRLIQTSVNGIYDRFINLVARGRDMTPKAVDDIGQGRVWLGSQALDIGLVDQLGDLEDAVAAAAELADIEEYGVKRFQPPKQPGEELLQQLMESQALGARGGAASDLGQRLSRAWVLANSLNDPSHRYAVCEPCLGLADGS
ncbi:MAG: signal peptide peptidase SppA [Gammaproteobacteria bacterium]|nr:signal peptide peptidase SppA [Gammaproteobacteria bacterium]MDE0274052.1 signal peptide peptidase SppA [Gammaproteobacteria bacterium]